LSSANGREPLKFARASAIVLGFTYAGASIAGRLAIFDNLSNFPVHFAAGFLAFAVLFAALKSRSWALACCGAAALAFAPVVPWYFGPDAAPGDATRQFAKILVSNVYVANSEHELLRQRIAEENPDLVGLVEVNSTWISKLEPLRAGYPYHFEVPDERFIGLALYSRLPLSNPRALDLGPPSTPAIAATVKTQEGELELILAHPVPPMNAEFIRQRNEQILSISRYVGTSGKPIVLAGDLNITMWNDGYRPLVDAGGLHNAREGHGVGPTWPSIWRLGVPIDHILATPDVVLRNFRVLGRVGSDHFPISAEFGILGSQGGVAGTFPGNP
jgi:endonuclease/exonuclease/phosphatase (EEP) superfamily protein YafD